MKVFLTGATGFIGHPLTQCLLRRGWSVTALVRKPDSPQAQALSRLGVQLAAGDILERESMRAPMGGADIVIHAAGHYELACDQAGREHMRACNVTGTDHVLGLALELGIPRAVHVSTLVTFGATGRELIDETTARRQAPCRMYYEQTKTEAHAIALQYQERGLPLIIACPGQVVGANDHSVMGYFVRLYVNRVMPPLGWSPNALWPVVYLDDVAEGIALAAEKGRLGEVYFLCGEIRTFRESFGYWSLRPGAFPARVWLPSKLAALLFAPLEPLQRSLGLPAFISREAVAVSSGDWCYCSDKAKQELGWAPRSAEAMWMATLDGEIALLPRRKGQNLIQRLRPLAIVPE